MIKFESSQCRYFHEKNITVIPFRVNSVLARRHNETEDPPEIYLFHPGDLILSCN